MDTDQVAEWVIQAQVGDQEGFAALVAEFGDLVTAVCVGHLGDPDLARDAAQDTFVTALGAIATLREPGAFPAWLLRVARTCSRRARPSVRTLDLLPDPVVVEENPGSQAALVRSALAALAPQDRTVLALAYLGGYSQAEIGEFLGVPVSTVKKRAFDARRRLKGLLPMVEANLQAHRPSETPKFSNVILLFAAIRRGDAGAVAEIINAHPELVEVEEAWDVQEGREAGLVFPARGTPLVRAAELGLIDIVEVLLAAGAGVDGACGCETAESPLWAATVNGQTQVVSRLLAAGADPNRSAGPGLSPLHIAVSRQRSDLADLLVEAGADPTRVDDSGRTPKDWAEANIGPLVPEVGPILPIGLKILDLFAPLPRGGLVYWHGSYGLGQLVLLAEIATALAPVPLSWIGYECDLVDRTEITHLQAEAGLDDSAFTINLLPPSLALDDQTALLDAAVRSLERRATLQTQIAIVVDHPDHTASVEAYLPRLQANPDVLTTIFLSPRFGTDSIPSQPPPGFDAQVVLDPDRAHRGLWPAIDGARSVTATYASEQHRLLAEQVRAALAGADELAERLHAYLTQPLRVSQPFLGAPAQSVSIGRLLADVEALLGGAFTDQPAKSLLYQGALP